MNWDLYSLISEIVYENIPQMTWSNY